MIDRRDSRVATGARGAREVPQVTRGGPDGVDQLTCVVLVAKPRVPVRYTTGPRAFYDLLLFTFELRSEVEK